MKLSNLSRVVALAAVALMAAAAVHADAWGLAPAFAALGVSPTDVLLGLAGAAMLGEVHNHEHYDEADLPAINVIALAAASAGAPLRQDASIFFGRQLDYVRARIYERKTPAMRAFDMVPVSTDVPDWAETVTQRSFDSVGIAKIIANYADDLPRADVFASETVVKVKDVGVSYGYNIAELRASEATGAQLDTKKASAARKSVDIKINQLAMIGEAVYGLFGLLNHPNIGTTAGLNGDWGNPATTAEQILSDLNTLTQAIPGQSKGVHRTTRIAMADTDYNVLSTKYVADSGGKTVLQVYRENNPAVTLIPVVELRDAGAGGLNAIIASEFDADNYAFEMVMPFNQLPAQARNLELVVPCLARAGGVNVTYPLAITKGNI